MSEPSVPRPPFDPGYKGACGPPDTGEPFDVTPARKFANSTWTADGVLAKHPQLTYTDITISAIEGLDDNSIGLAVFQTKNSSNRNRPVVLYVHGGGQLVGNRFHCVEQVLSLIFPINDDIVFTSVEYRLAPEHRAPAGAYDCYAAVVYLVKHAAKLGIDSSKIMVYGISGGSPVAAAACLLARKYACPQICAQMLCIPMLDDRDHWPSHKQFETGTLWPGTLNRQAWDMVLGTDRGEPEVDEIRSPGRATDLSNLPPAFIDVGECEVFRDSAVAFASQIWKSGGSAELHVWPGMHHAGAVFEPDVPVSKAALNAQKNFIERAFGFRRGSSGSVDDVAQASL